MLEPIPFAGYVEIDEIDNEPAAYLMVERNDGNSYIQMGVPTRDEKISHQPYPLYTHPADESFDRTASHMAGEYVSYPAKTLTDEEIMDCIEDKTGYSFNACDEDLLDFARAILRKAQEK
jgi:hypothetical protein